MPDPAFSSLYSALMGQPTMLSTPPPSSIASAGAQSPLSPTDINQDLTQNQQAVMPQDPNVMQQLALQQYMQQGMGNAPSAQASMMGSASMPPAGQ